MKFVERTTAPAKDNVLYNSKDNIYYMAGAPMPNCTAYAWGRFWEATGVYPKIGLWNATEWFGRAGQMGLKTGSKPKLGAIICWQGAGSNMCGHVGVVEKIYPDGSVLVSESAWGGIYWNNQLVASPANNYQHPTSPNKYPCQGFIYPEVEFDNQTEIYRVRKSWADDKSQIGAYGFLDNAIKAVESHNGYKAYNTKGEQIFPIVKEDYAKKVEKNQNIVRKNYIDILEREVDAGGFETYTEALNSGWTEDRLREDLKKSNENINDTKSCHKFWFIVRCYKCILGRYPESDAVVNGRLKMSYQDIFESIYNSPEAKNRRK